MRPASERSASGGELPEAVVLAALEAGRKASGWASPRAPSAAVLHRGEVVLAARAADASCGALAALLAEGPAPDGADLFLLAEPEPGEVDRYPLEGALEGVGRVRIATMDPGLGGAGAAALEARGLVVERGRGATPAVLRHLEPWWEGTRLGRPFVLLKAAASLDGRVATRTGASQWITGEAARARGRRFRAELDAIVVGVETAIADDPALTARAPGAHDPLRVVLDARARTPATSVLVRTASATPTLIATTSAAPETQVAALREAGARVERLPPDPEGRVALPGLLAVLYGLGIRSLLVEGGPRVAGSFVDGGWVDRVAWFVAPRIIGGEAARSAIGGLGAGPLDAALGLEGVEVEQLGPDLLVTGRVVRPTRS